MPSSSIRAGWCGALAAATAIAPPEVVPQRTSARPTSASRSGRVAAIRPASCSVLATRAPWRMRSVVPGTSRYPSMNVNAHVPVTVTRAPTPIGLPASWQLEARRQLAAVHQRVDLGDTARVQPHVTLVDARLLDEQPRVHEPLPDRERERAVVTGEAAREVR